MRVNHIYQGTLVAGCWAGEKCKVKYLGPSDEFHGPDVNRFEIIEYKEWPPSEDPDDERYWNKGDILDLTNSWSFKPIGVKLENK